MTAPNKDDLWDHALKELQKELPLPTYETYLRKTRLLAIYQDLVVIGAPNEFIRSYVETRLAQPIKRCLTRLLQRPVELETVAPDPQVAAAQEVVVTPSPRLDGVLLPPARPPSPPLNPKYTFSTFVVGSSNRMAHAASMAVAESPAKAYNPLFIYGGVGLGKTHLMHAIAHHILAHNPYAHVHYTTGENFANELIAAIRENRTVDFKARYRNVDLLLVDDIQFIAGKESTQEEFFHTFNALYEAGRQIVLTSDRPPKEITPLEERLRSRFEWGLISDIQPPDYEHRVAILQKKAQLDNLTIPQDVIEFIAERVETNIRELEGALIRLVAHASIENRPIDLAFAQQTLSELFPKHRARTITVEAIQTAVARHFNLKPQELRERRRTRQVAYARQVAMYLARELTDLSLPRIGEEFGGRDHTTVLHAIEKIRQDMAQDRDLRALIESLKAKLRT